MNKIKNCPFCGFEMDVYDEDCLYPISREKNVWKIVCYGLKGGCSASIFGKSPEDCIEKWNKRVVYDKV